MIRGFVIAIEGNRLSQEAADRCIKTAARFGTRVEKSKACTPANNPEAMMAALKWDTSKFFDQYSVPTNAMACFMSHYALWARCILLDEPIYIFEHDAVIKGPLPLADEVLHCANLAKPSYGQFRSPSQLGYGPLTSKPGGYFGGAHGYLLTPAGAAMLCDRVNFRQISPAPADLFLCIQNFPTLQEYYPWPVECDDSFTTIQKKSGCQAKHNFKANPNEFRIVS